MNNIMDPRNYNTMMNASKYAEYKQWAEKESIIIEFMQTLRKAGISEDDIKFFDQLLTFKEEYGYEYYQLSI